MRKISRKKYYNPNHPLNVLHNSNVKTFNDPIDLVDFIDENGNMILTKEEIIKNEKNIKNTYLGLYYKIINGLKCHNIDESLLHEYDWTFATFLRNIGYLFDAYDIFQIFCTIPESSLRENFLDALVEVNGVYYVYNMFTRYLTSKYFEQYGLNKIITDKNAKINFKYINQYFEQSYSKKEYSTLIKYLSNEKYVKMIQEQQIEIDPIIIFNAYIDQNIPDHVISLMGHISTDMIVKNNIALSSYFFTDYKTIDEKIKFINELIDKKYNFTADKYMHFFASIDYSDICNAFIKVFEHKKILNDAYLLNNFIFAQNDFLKEIFENIELSDYLNSKNDKLKEQILEYISSDKIFELLEKTEYNVPSFNKLCALYKKTNHNMEIFKALVKSFEINNKKSNKSEIIQRCNLLINYKIEFSQIYNILNSYDYLSPSYRTLPNSQYKFKCALIKCDSITLNECINNKIIPSVELFNEYYDYIRTKHFAQFIYDFYDSSSFNTMLKYKICTFLDNANACAFTIVDILEIFCKYGITFNNSFLKDVDSYKIVYSKYVKSNGFLIQKILEDINVDFNIYPNLKKIILSKSNELQFDFFISNKISLSIDDVVDMALFTSEKRHIIKKHYNLSKNS